MDMLLNPHLSEHWTLYYFYFFFRLTYYHTEKLFGALHIDPNLQRSINPLSHNDDFWRTGRKSILKTLWEKKKMLVNSIFFFTHNVLYPMKDNFNILNNI